MTDLELYHYGIKGMKWGERNGPPYPLNDNIKKKSQFDKNIKNDKPKSKSTIMNDDVAKKNARIKKILIGVGAVTLTAVTAYAGYKFIKKNPEILNKLMKKADKNVKINDPLKRLDIGEVVSKCYSVFGTEPKSFISSIDSTPYVKQIESDKYYSSISGSLSDSIKYYSEQGFRDINGYLRGRTLPKENEETVLQHISNITKIIGGSEIKEDVVVHRAASRSLSNLLGLTSITKNDVEQLKGHRFTDKAFHSTSLGLITAREFNDTKIVEHILVPKGTKALSVSKFSKWKEQELLLQRGTTFSIKDVLFDSSGNVTDIFLDIVDQLRGE